MCGTLPWTKANADRRANDQIPDKFLQGIKFLVRIGIIGVYHSLLKNRSFKPERIMVSPEIFHGTGPRHSDKMMAVLAETYSVISLIPKPYAAIQHFCRS